MADKVNKRTVTSVLRITVIQAGYSIISNNYNIMNKYVTMLYPKARLWFVHSMSHRLLAWAYFTFSPYGFLFVVCFLACHLPLVDYIALVPERFSSTFIAGTVRATGLSIRTEPLYTQAAGQLLWVSRHRLALNAEWTIRDYVLLYRATVRLAIETCDLCRLGNKSSYNVPFPGKNRSARD